jgi:RNA-binding protein
MLNSKQRAYLRGLSNGLEPVVILGKGNIDDDVIKQIDDVLEARELIKIKLLNTSSYEPRQACGIITDATGADCVQVIGNKFVLYRPSKEKPTIELP